MELYVSLIAAFVGSALFAWVLLPIIQKVSFQKKLFDPCDERKVHMGIIPRLGGVSFFPAMIVSFFLVMSVNIIFGTTLNDAINRELLQEWMLVMSSLIFLYMTGITDDLVDIRYRNKLIIQLITAVLFVASGVWIDNLHGIFGVYEIEEFIGIPLTIIVVVSIINAFNFIDGIDGLAAGVGMLAFLFFGFTFLYLGLHIYSIFSFAALGMLIPFFYFNTFGKVCKKSKIFMGDCGSLTIGLLLAVFSIKVYQSASLIPGHSPRPLVMGFAVLIVPLFDALRVVLLRVLKGRSPFKPDRSHMHHQLLDLGFSHKIATLFMMTNAIFFGTLTFLLVPFLNINFLMLGVALLWGILDYVLRRCVKKGVHVASFQR